MHDPYVWTLSCIRRTFTRDNRRILNTSFNIMRFSSTDFGRIFFFLTKTHSHRAVRVKTVKIFRRYRFKNSLSTTTTTTNLMYTYTCYTELAVTAWHLAIRDFLCFCKIPRIIIAFMLNLRVAYVRYYLL